MTKEELTKKVENFLRIISKDRDRLYFICTKKAIGDLGLNEKTKVAGYDGINLPLEQDFPTVKVPYTEMGRTALEEMLDPEFRMPQIVKLQPEIIMHAKSGGELIR